MHGTELHDEIARLRAKMLAHRRDRLRVTIACSVPFLPGMHQPDRAAHGIDQINRAAIGDVNA